MRIPKSFKLLGHTIIVEEDIGLTTRTDNTGEAHFRHNKIILQPLDGYKDRPISRLEQVFVHELVHFILYFSECEKTKGLTHNELVVDRIASLLHQALSTMEYE